MRYYKKTSIIKKAFTGVLASAASIGMLAGMHLLSNANMGQANAEKSKILNEFQLTEEYKTAKLEKEEEITQDFLTGKITYAEKEEEIASLNSKLGTEDILVEYGNEDFNEQINEVNEGILKETKDFLKGTLVLVSSGVLTIALAYKFAGMSNEFKYDELENDEELSQRPVIV